MLGRGQPESEVEFWRKKLKGVQQALEAHEATRKKLLAQQALATDAIKRENRVLREELLLDTKVTLALPTASQQERIQQLDALLDTYSRKSLVEARQLQEVEREIALSMARADAARLAGASQATAQEAAVQMAKHERVIEGRICQAEARLNGCLAKNMTLHGQIDALSKQYGTLEALYQRLEGQLASRKAELHEVQADIEDAQAETQGIEDALAGVRQDLEEATDRKDAYMRERASGILTGRRGTHDGMTADQRQAAAAAQLAYSAALSHNQRPPRGVAGQRPLGGAPLAAGLQMSTAVGALRALQDGTGIVEWQQLVEYCLNLEARTAAAAAQHAAASKELSGLQQQAVKLQDRLADLERPGAEARQVEMLAQTSDKIEQTTARARELQGRQANIDNKLGLIKTGVAGMLRALGSTVGEEGEGASGADGDEGPKRTGSELMRMLAELEARARAVASVHKKLNALGAQHGAFDKPKPAAASSGAGKAAASGPAADVARMMAKPAGHDDDDDDDDDEEAPLTREQIRARSLQAAGGGK